MIKGGVGGANTLTGLNFETKQNLADALARLADYQISGTKILYKGKEIGLLLKKKQLYSQFLTPDKLDVDKIVSRRLEPDNAVILPQQKRATILELKFQETEGSVDEKLQTCAFKLQQYNKLFGPLGYKVKYTYVLGEWFMNPKYKDVLNYIEGTGCQYYFGQIPLDALGLPK